MEKWLEWVGTWDSQNEFPPLLVPGPSRSGEGKRSDRGRGDARGRSRDTGEAGDGEAQEMRENSSVAKAGGEPNKENAIPSSLALTAKSDDPTEWTSAGWYPIICYKSPTSNFSLQSFIAPDELKRFSVGDSDDDNRHDCGTPPIPCYLLECKPACARRDDHDRPAHGQEFIPAYFSVGGAKAMPHFSFIFFIFAITLNLK